MQPNRPWNVWGMDVANAIRKERWGEVTSSLMYEPSTTAFHPAGLYSEIIFGQIGTVERISRLGYISLHCDIMSPIIYLNILNVCGWYQDLMEGKVSAIYDPSINAFTPVNKDAEGANTGFAFFMQHVNDLKFTRNKSVSRNNKISVIERMIEEKTNIIRQYPVCPAGWRDVKSDGSGRLEVDEVNKLYNALLMMSAEIKNGLNNPILVPFFNNVKYHIQLKVVEIFNHWKSFYEGKTGFGQAHYAKRNLALGTRGVITAPPLLAKSPDAPDYIKYDETQLSLYHAAKAASPVVVHNLNAMFTSQVYTQGSINVPAIDKKTLQVRYVEVSPAEITYALDSKSKHDFINSFKDTTERANPVEITDVHGESYWMWMVYDLDDEIYVFRGLSDLEKMLSDEDESKKEKIDMSKVRPLTKVEMLYLATFAATHTKYATITRFPAVETGSIYPSKVVVATTSPSRIVVLKSQYNKETAVQLPHYPVLTSKIYCDSVTIHPSKTTGLTADYDGDKINVNMILTTEGLQEAKDHLDDPRSMISPAGKFYDTVNTNAVRFTLHALTMLQSNDLPTAE